MNLAIHYVPFELSENDVKREIAKILHSDDFTPRRHDQFHRAERQMNFKITLNPSPAGGVRNDGTGVLTLPDDEMAKKFLRWIKATPFKIERRKLKFFPCGSPPSNLRFELDRTPYTDPNLEEEHQRKVWALSDSLRVDVLQVGVFYHPSYPNSEKQPVAPRAFSVEWESNHRERSKAWLSFEYDHKVIRIKLGDSNVEPTGASVAINFSSIHKVAVGYDGSPYICFDLLVPPVMESIDFHRTLVGDDYIDNTKYKRRIGALHEGHRIVAPYAHHIRLLLYNDPVVDMVEKFVLMYQTAGLRMSQLYRCNGMYQIDARKCGFFAPKELYRLTCILKKLPWCVAFQLEALLYNHLLHSKEVFSFIPYIETLRTKFNDDYIGTLFRRFGEALRSKDPRKSPMQCLEDTQKEFDVSHFQDSFVCYHVSVTPTRYILEGPYPAQSNRVIRQYRGYEEHFLRVDFRDEDRLQYRWTREVDGASLLRERVGDILKRGLDIAGRHFEFLAYSSSSLREHAVWFIHPFTDARGNNITSQFIRNSLGDFSAELRRRPSKFAARLAQAFTATDPSVMIRKEYWEKVDDLGRKPYLFTDGVGTISQALADRIWERLCESRRDKGRNVVPPSAYQIRFLGFKGVVSIDKHLDGNKSGVQMRLRPSMEKFAVSQADEADIEIAQSFQRPGVCYLNRPLIMLLEDLGVRLSAFTDLQDQAVAEARTIHDSSAQFRQVLASHSLGHSYRLESILERLEKLGLDLIPRRQIASYDNQFLRLVRQVAMNSVLRDIKHSARIPVPDSYLLVGVADEGPAYLKAGHPNVYALPTGSIYACVQKSADSKPIWLEGPCSISRSPVAHPGDVQRVRAIGKPPEGMMCAFSDLKNVVVLPSTGPRSLASMLGGGDVDGDMFSVIFHEPLLPSICEYPAEYPEVPERILDRESTVDDICGFIVEYFHSDILGLLSDRLIVICDQSKEGIFDKDCKRLAELCSKAVDYPKFGVPVDMNNIPRPLIRCKPDWHAAEVVSPRKTDYYESTRALGVMFRSIALDDPTPATSNTLGQRPLQDPISLTLLPIVQRHIQADSDPGGKSPFASWLFKKYSNELRYICNTHTLSNEPGVTLLEAEVVVGTILANCTQVRWRKDRIYRMRLHSMELVKNIQREMMSVFHEATEQELLRGLERAWDAWEFSGRNMDQFGASSFGLIALGIVLDCLDVLSEKRHGADKLMC